METIEQLDAHIKQTETIQKLQSQDKEIISDLENLKEGQTQLNDKVEIGFEKGRKRMDGIEDEMKNIKQMLIESDKKRDEQHGAILNKITDSEISRLQKQIEDRDKSLEKKDTRVWEAAKIFLTAIVSIVATAYLVSTGIK